MTAMHRSLTALALPLLITAGLGAQPAPPEFDLLIRGGRVVDGTGNPSYLGDVGIRDGRIAAVGRLSGRAAARTLDASGKVVAPGFIDIHNHSDETIVADGDAPSFIRQGVTTMIFGEGGSAAPTERWKDFSAYFGELKQRGIATNVGSYLGSGLVWSTVRGNRPGPPTAEERQRMRAIVRQSMEQGALGVASSLSGPPGVWIDTDTLVAMCEVAGEHGGLYSTHMRTEGKGVFQSVAEAIEIGRRAKLPVDIIHLKIADHALWGRMPEVLAQIEKARAAGQQVQANVYPYRAGQNNLASIIPPWAHEGGSAAMIRRLQDPALRPRLEREILNGIPGSDWYNHYTATGGWEGMLLVSLRNPEYRKFQGKRMSEVIRTVGKPPVDVLFELLEKNGGSVGTIYFHHAEEDMQRALKHPLVSIGSDGTAVNAEKPNGHPHPRYYGTFPRVLGRYVRDQKLLTLEEAIRKMTSANAAKIHVYDRGLLRAGQWADVTVFDAAKVIDRATFEQPHQYAEGIETVIVNGKLVLDGGKPTGARPGGILHGPGTRTGGARVSWLFRPGHPVACPDC